MRLTINKHEQRIVLLLVLVLISLSLLAEDRTFQEKLEIAKKDWKNQKYELYISPGIIADAGLKVFISNLYISYVW